MTAARAGEGMLSTEDDRLREALEGLGIALAGYFGLQVAAIVLGSLLIGLAGDLTSMQLNVVSAVATGFGAVGFGIVYFNSSRHDASFLDLDAPDIRDAGYVVGGFLLLLAVLYAIVLTATLLGVGLSEHQIGDAADAADPLLVLALVPLSLLFVGPGEELIFRGIVQKRLTETFSDSGAIAITSLGFAAIHFPAYATAALPRIAASLALVFSLSVLLGWVYARTRKLVVPALVHGLFNAFQFTLLYADVAGI